jgi:hypothetical protein
MLQDLFWRKELVKIEMGDLDQTMGIGSDEEAFGPHIYQIETAVMNTNQSVDNGEDDETDSGLIKLTSLSQRLEQIPA